MAGGLRHLPFDRQVAALAADHHVVIPDRSGYGGSGRVARQAIDFIVAARRRLSR